MSNPTATQDTKAEPTQQPQQQKPPVLEEDDEPLVFPVMQKRELRSAQTAGKMILRMTGCADLGALIADWPQEETEQGSAANGASAHLWEESWDDDDAAEDFSKQLKEELKKVGASNQ
ncbi:putative 26S proteasome complex subunit sem-1 [Aspergillus awamori]|uniref:26S proteasome complex subunit SEM1 n=1 Tax=Aspergillus awamori TaxID=105351 RepID=A0A401KT49_ASPAW|nr:putative 26S proteasome complex subunit sem-1 [Aspergillus awamori]